uniref:Seminal fluid protein n=1 Tax=Nilaparvata lugens TaxID=108931 RepID=A0A220XIJ7_NILLU|nr:hypothetical protein [Nilaparvata lugens]
MHIYTIGILTIFLHSIAVGVVQESKSWADFESAMKKNGSYALVLVDDSNKDIATPFLDGYCIGYPNVKCYYGMEGNSTQPQTSFNQHFKNNGTPVFILYKDGKQYLFIKRVDLYLDLISDAINYVFQCVLSISHPDTCIYSPLFK